MHGLQFWELNFRSRDEGLNWYCSIQSIGNLKSFFFHLFDDLFVVIDSCFVILYKCYSCSGYCVVSSQQHYFQRRLERTGNVCSSAWAVSMLHFIYRPLYNQVGSAENFYDKRPGFKSQQGLCVVFLNKTLYFHSDSLLEGVLM